MAFAIAVQVFRFEQCAMQALRLQARWIVTGLIIAAAGFLGFLYFTPVLVPSVQQASSAHLYYILIGVPALYMTTSAIPLSLAISILKYRLWDISLDFKRTRVYVPLTGILAGLYAANIKAIPNAFVAGTGSSAQGISDDG